MTKINLFLKRQSGFTPKSLVILFMLTLGLSASPKVAQAKSPATAPPQLKTLLNQVDTAATGGNINQVMQYYSPSFVHGDGLNRQTMQQSLSMLWKQYPSLRYTTRLQSWENRGSTIVADTITNIVGLPSANKQKMAMNATIKSRQYITNGKIVRQDILSERTQITSGKNPPEVNINLPKEVKIGEKYYFDAIVNEPLGDSFLLGAALDEPIQANKYLQPTSVDLELLSAGGLFKIGQAPNVPGNEWVSAVLVRGDGMTMVTQRLRIIK